MKTDINSTARKPATPGRGVQTLADLRDRCRIDDITGCWLWSLCCSTPRGGITPLTHIGAGLVGNASDVTMPAARVAWMLAGNKLKPGNLVWRHVCKAGLCINPDHCRVGTRRDMHAAIAGSGRNKGSPIRAVTNAKNRLLMMTPPEAVRRAEVMFAGGEMQKTVRAELGIGQLTAAAIRKGLHPHSAGRQRLVRGASVFSLGAA